MCYVLDRIWTKTTTRPVSSLSSHSVLGLRFPTVLEGCLQRPVWAKEGAGSQILRHFLQGIVHRVVVLKHDGKDGVFFAGRPAHWGYHGMGRESSRAGVQPRPHSGWYKAHEVRNINVQYVCTHNVQCS